MAAPAEAVAPYPQDPPSERLLLLEYEYAFSGDELIQKRAPHFDEHLRVLLAAAGSGKLWLFGPMGDPKSGGLLVWRGASEDEVRSFTQTDPFVTQGLVTKWSIRPFHAVGGEGMPK